MPIFVNWFETEVSAPIQKVFFRDFPNWEDSKTWHEKVDLPSERYTRFSVKSGEGEVARTILFGGVQPIPSEFAPFEVDLNRERKLTERIIEFNLGEYFAKRGMSVEYGGFGASATKPSFRVSDIGLRVDAGVSFKSFYLHYKQQHGITLNWRVRQAFDQPISALPETAYPVLHGLPVILRDNKQSISDDLQRYAGRYVGVITELKGKVAVVLCRDSMKRDIPTDALVPEAKPEVVASLSSISKEQRGNESIQRRILTLTHSLTPSGRRNIRILQDQLRSAIDCVNPENRPFLTLDFIPFCVGRMRISMAPAVAQVQQDQYV